ncbi:protein suppressor of white apricot-like isoform X3 [Chenopodium quinoa]|uniref:protein suppressor of white apricot-like isoform X3 n=1 Tax=Chenopodium quinoa TaxID=63459 RepID=UPI000B786DB8|nr:protein suppressor of white apricot-like isoform X3 [Chenopodium quinoa]XP_021758968.1 protein suppressor of white apricot-like isoform X3 [Chenopodium quinoa]
MTKIENEAAKTDASGYHFVPFSYENSTDSSDQKNLDVTTDTSVFHPPFTVPESLLQNLPPTDKVHHIIARTALFVGENGGQSEIVLRVKQGDNPTFGFLMPHHHLHPYFRYLVDHPELLKADRDSKSQRENTNEDQTIGALSLLGSFYGTGEDEDVAAVPNQESDQVDSDETTAVALMSKSHAVEKITGSESESGKDEIVSKVAHPSKVKVPSSSKNRSSSIKSVKANAVNKDSGTLASAGSIMDKSKTSSLFPVSEVETLLVDPPTEVKRLVDRIVEIILKNGRDFEAVLIEQDKKHGRFPFLVPSNQYHPYYLKVLKKVQESRLSGKSFNSETEKNTASRKDSHISSSVGCGSDDSALDCDKKEKFKMVISKSKKDAHDHPSKETQQHSGITVDAAAAAAILQAATRGIKKPNLDIFSKTSLSGVSRGSSNEGGQASSFGSLQSSQNQSSGQKFIENQKSNVTIPVAKEIANTAARAAAGEADSSEAGMTKEQKLKAERLRRAKMFAAMIKSGVAPLGTEPQEASSVKPSSSDFPGSATEVANGEVKDREGSCVPGEAETSKRIEMPVRNSSDDEIGRKARKSRHYRSRIHDGSEGEEDEYLGKSGNDEEYDDPRHSRKKHRSHNSSRHHRDRSKDTHKHRKKHSLSRNRKSQHRHNHDRASSPYEDDRHNRYKYDSSSDYEQKGHKRKHKHDSSSDDEHKRHKRKYKHDSSSDEDEHRHRKQKHDSSSDEDEHRHRKHKHDNSSDEDKHRHHKRKPKHYRKEEYTHKRKSRKGERKSLREEIELEEGEIRTKSSDQSSSAIGDDVSAEASVDVSKISYQDKAPSLPPETTEVPDELRAKIRAMLLATM